MVRRTEGPPGFPECWRPEARYPVHGDERRFRGGDPGRGNAGADRNSALRPARIIEALDPGVMPGPARVEQKAWLLLDAPPPAAAGHIALRNPASRKLGVSLHGHPLGGAKRCFAERHRLAPVPDRTAPARAPAPPRAAPRRTLHDPAGAAR